MELLISFLGIDAKRKIDEAKEQYKKKKFKLKPLLLLPTDDMKSVNRKINNSITVTVEHLLSYEFWKKIKQKGWVKEKKTSEIIKIFENVMDMKKSTDSLIDEIVDNSEMKETVICLMPKDEKKDRILKLAQNEIQQGNNSVVEGFCNTIMELEKEFC